MKEAQGNAAGSPSGGRPADEREGDGRKKAVRKGGRPPRLEAERIRDQILDIAAGHFFTHGYGTTSIEAIARDAGISKRTFYHRFKDKADIFSAVVHRLVGRLKPRDMQSVFEGKSIEDILYRIAPAILTAVLSPEALALHRLILAEAQRFPELAQVAVGEGTRGQAVQAIALLLEKETTAGRMAVEKPVFAAEQFMLMVSGLPQRRAMGLGKAMTRPELDAWARDTVDLFLRGCRGR